MTIATEYIANIVAARDPAEALAVFVNTIHEKILAISHMDRDQEDEVDEIFLDIRDDLKQIIKAMQIRHD